MRRPLLFLILALTGLSVFFGFAATLPVDGGVLQVFEEEISIEGQEGTSLAALKNAEGFWEQEDGVDRFGVRGAICVSNQGDWQTRGLAVVDVVQIKAESGPFVDYVSQAVDLASKPVLAAGETACYAYEIPLTPVAGARYKNVARITITNHAGWMPGDKNCPGPDPCPFGPETKVNFNLPKSPTIIGEGSAAGKRAPEQTPTLAPEDEVTKEPVEGGAASATAPPEEATGVPATSAPTEIPTVTETPTATVTLPTQTEFPTPTLAPTASLAPGGCTYSAEYWRWNPQAWPVSELNLGERLYLQSEALELLQAEVEADETYPLAQQLIAAKLNVQNGAEAAAIADTIRAADEWLVAYPPGSHPPKPERNEAAALAARLGDYNAGLSGSHQCADEGSRPTPTPATEYTGEPGQTLVPSATSTPEPSPTGAVAPSPTPVVPSETPAPAATPWPSETQAPSPTASETPLPTPTMTEELPTEAPLPTEALSPEPTTGGETLPTETPTEESP